MGRIQILLAGQRRRRIETECRFQLNGVKRDLEFLRPLDKPFGVCLDHFVIDLQMAVQGLDLRRRRVTKLGHEELLLPLLLALLVFRVH